MCVHRGELGSSTSGKAQSVGVLLPYSPSGNEEYDLYGHNGSASTIQRADEDVPVITHNLERMDYDEEDLDTYDDLDQPYVSLTETNKEIKAYHIDLRFPGSDSEVFEVTVSTQSDGDMDPVALTSGALDVGKSMIVLGKLPRQLKVTRTAEECGSKIDFVFGDPGDPADKLALFSSNTGDASIPK